MGEGKRTNNLFFQEREAYLRKCAQNLFLKFPS